MADIGVITKWRGTWGEARIEGRKRCTTWQWAARVSTGVDAFSLGLVLLRGTEWQPWTLKLGLLVLLIEVELWP